MKDHENSKNEDSKNEDEELFNRLVQLLILTFVQYFVITRVMEI